MTMMRMMVKIWRSPVWVLLGLSLVLGVLGDQQDPQEHPDPTTQDPTIQDQIIQEETISAKRVPLLGGWCDRSPESEEIKAATVHSVDDFNSHSKAKKTFRLVSIISARTQVTNMINYKLKVLIGKTSCLKSDTKEAENCTLAKKRLLCRFDLQFDPRKQVHTMELSSCNKITILPTPSVPINPCT